MFPAHIHEPGLSSLSLQQAQLADWPAILHALTHPAFPSRLPLSRLQTEEQVQDWLRQRQQDWQQAKVFVWSIWAPYVSKGEGGVCLVGQISLFQGETDWMLAYWVCPTQWGKGIATRACLLVMKAFHQACPGMGLQAGVADWNLASARVLTKLNFVEERRQRITLINGITENVIQYRCSPSFLLSF